MRDGGTSGPAPFLAAVLPLLAGPLTLGLLQLALDTRPDAGRSLQDLWYEGGRGVMTVAAAVAALSALGSGVALFAVGRGKLLALAALPALALTVMLPAVVGARLGWAELAVDFPSVRGWERPLVLAGGAVEIERVVLATLLFDALLVTCWAAALVLLALDARSPARRVLAALALISAALGALFGATAHVDLLRAAVEEVPRYAGPKDLLDQLLAAAARWSSSQSHVRLAAGVFGAVLVLAVIVTRGARARVGVAAWGLLCVVGVSGARALTRMPTALVSEGRPALNPSDYLDFDGDDADVSSATAVLGERLEPLNLTGEQLRVDHHRTLLAKNASATALRELLDRAFANAPQTVELLSLARVNVDAPATVQGLLQRARSVRVELAVSAECAAPCLFATLDAQGLQLTGSDERWPLEEQGPGSGDLARPLFLELGPWEPRWLVGAVHAAAKRGHQLFVVWTVSARATLEHAKVEGPLSSAAVKAAARVLECHSPEHGLLTLRAVVSPAGTVGQVQVRQSTLENARLEACFAQQLREWRFPRAPRPSLVDLDFSVTQVP